MKAELDTLELYRQDALPVLQNRTYDSQSEARSCARGDVRLVEDLRSGLVYNAAFRPESMVYDVHYQNEQGLSPLFHAHLESVAALVERSMGRESLVEVGCGKGYFLELLLARGFDVTGFDPSYEGSNPRVVRRYFDGSVGFAARALVLRHVLEHVQDPYSFLLQLKKANGGSGLIYIEVPCFDWICRRRAWFDVFYEHVNYFRMSDFHRLFAGVVESGRLFGEQYLYVVADIESLRPPRMDPLDRVGFPRDFVRAIAARPGGDAGAAIWGAASKGVIFALLKERAGQPVTAAIDINPAKQGRYLPATGLLVEKPQDALAKLPKGSTIYVMNSNYLEEVKSMSGNAYHYVEADRD